LVTKINKPMNKYITFLIVLANFTPIFAQEQKTVIKFSGFIKNDYFFDSRQTINIREGHFLLYPSEIITDSLGNDINARPTFNFLSIQSRITATITGPDAFGAKTSGILEADFFGNAGSGLDDVNGLRLRHAYTKLNWKHTELLFGQTWHPFFNTNVFPGVISFNTGVPFQPFSRNPQLRITHKISNISILFAALAQRDFTSPVSALTLRNAAIPDAQFQMQYQKKNDSLKTEIVSGFGLGYKTLVPRISSVNGLSTYAVNEKISSFSASVFGKIVTPKFTVKIYGTYGENLFDLTLPGGYAIDSVSNTLTGARTYTANKNAAVWMELMSGGSRIQAGLFAGYTKNLGVNAKIMQSNLAQSQATIRGFNIDNVYRISPRIMFISGKLNLATELEITTAAYARKKQSGLYNINEKGIVLSAYNTTNYRLLIAVIYHF